MIQKRTPDRTDANQTEQFVTLLAKHQQAIRAYVFTLVPHHADADEVIQETSVVLWRKFDEFQTGTDFVRWAIKVAYFEILKFRRRRGKDRVVFCDEVLEKVSDQAAEMSTELEEQYARLASCLGKLSEKDRSIVALRYDRMHSVQFVAHELGRSVGGVYKSLQRIRLTLLNCVKRSSTGD